MCRLIGDFRRWRVVEKVDAWAAAGALHLTAGMEGGQNKTNFPQIWFYDRRQAGNARAAHGVVMLRSFARKGLVPRQAAPLKESAAW
mgnify:CR=1 FL=1